MPDSQVRLATQGSPDFHINSVNRKDNDQNTPQAERKIARFITVFKKASQGIISMKIFKKLFRKKFKDF